LWYAKFWKEEENPTAQARQNKVGVVRVSDSETGKENEISPTSRARQNQVGFLEVLVCKSFEKAKQVQVYKPSRIKLDLWRTSWFAILRESEISPTLQARRNKVGFVRVSDCET
jgi:hypothetical protein